MAPQSTVWRYLSSLLKTVKSKQQTITHERIALPPGDANELHQPRRMFYSRSAIYDLVFTIYYSVMEEREEFLTARQLAKVLQVSESTVRRLARKRRIPSVRVTPHIIRFHLDAVREALDVPRSRIRHGEFTEPVDDSQLSFDDLLALS